MSRCSWFGETYKMNSDEELDSSTQYYLDRLNLKSLKVMFVKNKYNS